MNIVQIEDFFHPDAGYQINVLSKYLSKFGHQVTIVTAELDKMPDFLTSFFGKDHIEERDRAYEEAYGVKICRLPIKRYTSGRAIFTDALLPTIQSHHPDVLFVHGNDTASAMWLLWNRKKLGCPILLDNHMAPEASSNRFASLFHWFYRTFMTPIIRKEQYFVIAMSEARYAEKVLGVPRELSPLVGFGSDVMLFYPEREGCRAFRREHGISEDAFVVLYAGKLDEAKNGLLLAELTNQSLKTNREVVYMIIGNAVGEYGASVELRFRESTYQILRFPTQKYSDLGRFFQAADLAVIPDQGSLILFDFNSAGLPVLVPDYPVNEARCSHNNGWVFRKKDIQDFKEKLEYILALPEEEFRKVSEVSASYIREEYSYEKKAREYEALLEKTVSRRQRRG